MQPRRQSAPEEQSQRPHAGQEPQSALAGAPRRMTAPRSGARDPVRMFATAAARHGGGANGRGRAERAGWAGPGPKLTWLPAARGRCWRLTTGADNLKLWSLSPEPIVS